MFGFGAYVLVFTGIREGENSPAIHGAWRLAIGAILKGDIEAAVAETKTAIESGDVEAMKEKASALAQVAMKLGEAIYQQEQASGGSADGATEEAPADDNVVDAEFSEVDEDKKD